MQQRVTYRMPQGIVYRLEPVEVEEQHRAVASIPSHLCKCLVDTLDDVPESCTWITDLVEQLEAKYSGSDALRCLRGIEDKHNREFEHFRDLGAAAKLSRPFLPIEQSHHAFNKEDISATRGVTKNVAVGLGAEHPCVEIACRAV